MTYRGLTTILFHVVILSYSVVPGALALEDGEELTDHDPDSPHFTEEWAVHVPGGERHARSVAEENGFRYVKQVSSQSLSFFSFRTC